MNYIFSAIVFVLGLVTMKIMNDYFNKDRDFRNFKDTNTYGTALGLIPVFIALLGGFPIGWVSLKTFHAEVGMIGYGTFMLLFGIYGSVLNYLDAKKYIENNSIDINGLKRKYFSKKINYLSICETLIGIGIIFMLVVEFIIFGKFIEGIQDGQKGIYRIAFALLLIATIALSNYLPRWITRGFAKLTVKKGGFNHEK